MHRKSPIATVLFLATGMLLSIVSACGRPDRQPPTPAPASPSATSVVSPTEAPAEEASYIDTHMHLDGLYRSGGADVKDYETAADNLIAEMDRSGVAQALVMPPPQNPNQHGAYDYQNLLGAVQKYPDRLYLVAGGGTLNPLIHGTEAAAVTPELKNQFEAKADELIRAGAVAFGEMAALHLCMSEQHHYIQAPPDHPSFLLLADIAARHNAPIDLHMEVVPQDTPTPDNLTQACSANPAIIPATIPAFERLLAHNREARIVWQHIGWDNTGYMTVDLIRELLETHSNLYLALRVEEREFMVGGGGPMPNRIVDENWQVRPEWLDLIRNYPDRFMIGGDEFVGIPRHTPRRPQSFEETWAILNQFPPDLARKVGYENAARVYNLD
jgi:hypothetical protein